MEIQPQVDTHVPKVAVRIDFSDRHDGGAPPSIMSGIVLLGALFLLTQSVLSLLAPYPPLVTRPSQRRWFSDALLHAAPAIISTTTSSPRHHRAAATVRPARSLSLGAVSAGDDEFREAPEPSGRSRMNEWVATGVSAAYLAQFASLYTQLPGLFGSTGLLPIADRLDSLQGLWALPQFPAELGMELFAAAGMALASAQIVFAQLRTGWAGIVTYGLQWVLWHDLVVAGGRFMMYQMDTLLLDVAPITLISCFSPGAAMFGYRWLLARLYFGAGSVKLLSCDGSWRDLSAVHWHFQSQPLPNPIGAWAHLHLPGPVGQALTWFVLVGEMAAPYLFLAPSPQLRRAAFGLNVIIMAGIATFGNFGSLQLLLTVIGFALLDEGTTGEKCDSAEPDAPSKASLSAGVNVVALGLAAAGAFWAMRDIGARCIDTLAIEPLAYDLIALGTAVAVLPLLLGGDVGAALLSLFLVASSVTTLGVSIPFAAFWDNLNVGAQRYGLFAVMTGVGGRPVPVIEGASSAEGPWHPIPLLYQVNDPSGPLPLCFPHFPRVDWTLWFIPTGESGLWIARFFQGITVSDPTVLGLLDQPSFHQVFPKEPPAIVRVVPRIYNWEDTGWRVSDDQRYKESPILATYKRKDPPEKRPTSWPSTPLLRPLAMAARSEYFIWGCLAASSVTRRVVESSIVTDWSDEN